MADESRKAPNPQSARTLKDDEIITERKLSRRSFVTAAGTLLAGGAAFLVAGSAASAQDQKDKDQATDPDKTKDSSKDKKETKEAATDPDKTKKDKKHKDKNKDKNKNKDKDKDQATDPDKPKS